MGENEQQQLSAGDAFPELELDTPDGKMALADRLREGPAVVAFERHFGWPHCREHLAQLGEAHEEIRSAGGQVIAIFQYPGDQVRDFCDGQDVPFDCLGDPRIEAYKQVGLGKGSFGEYLGVQMIGATVKAATKGHLVGNPKGGYVSLQPATFVVGSDGRVAYAHYNDDAADNAPTGEVVEAVKEAGPRERR